ncbi:MAG: excinuclease ABC subunit UvrA [Gammaproteobacteria bacterium HGW-Gammaproteobacteria-3]|nr:MAG: excinuclease ABC subunit UvrA [Gammaproteobacteria bacterium HGW-Gammaproteobacteria-3]
MDTISIRGARTHNLKNIDLDLPRDQLIVITGLSGSGKSSLAFDTLYAEGQRRYVESLSAYARQFLSMMEKPDVDHIEGLSPAIAIEQKSTSHNPRSTVGTITEIYDYLRLLYARAGTPLCPEHKVSLAAQTISQMVDLLMEQPEGQRWMLLAPIVNDRKGEYIQLLEDLRAQGFIRARIDGVVYDLDEAPVLEPRKKHSIDVIIDRFKIRSDISLRLAESFETALRMADGIAIAVSLEDDTTLLFSERYACPHCGYSLSELEPRIFSFNNPKGACPDCEGLGVKQHFDPLLVVHNPQISLAGGAIRGWDRRNGYYYQIICSLAEHYGFDPEAPYQELPEYIRNLLLYGSGLEQIDFKFLTGNRVTQTKRHSFEGIIANMERRYHETDSQMVRDELAKYLAQKTCADCGGARISIAARNVFVDGKPLHEITRLPIRAALSFFSQLDLPGKSGEVAARIIKEIQERLEFLVNVGLDYLTLERSADTLSGGEAQRIRLASQIGAGLVGVMYVLDEPSIGLHQRDNARLLNTLFRLRDLGNTVIVVEHDEDAIRAAQHVVDIGPGAGVHGGRIIAQGTPEDIIGHPDSLTGRYLSGKEQIARPSTTTPANPEQQIVIRNARGNNLKNVDIALPVGLLTCVTGVSGSGKSTLINDTLYLHAARVINRAGALPAPCDGIDGLQYFDKVIDIDQSPIGRTPRSNPATYTGIFTPVRELFAATPEARSRGYTPGRFSFNVKGGRCEACKGDGVIKVEMHFLPDIYVHCDVCAGKRYNRETLEIRYKGKSIHEVLTLTVEEASNFFSAVPVLARKLHTLTDVGLNYITLGQNATTLSGGEAQRVKLAKELSKRDTGKTLYILDEPTTGLHFHDIKQLLKVLHTLRDHGNTIIVIEHNLDVIKTADWLIDMGPEGGDGGGMLVAEGTPEQIVQCTASHTGHYLKRFFEEVRETA